LNKQKEKHKRITHNIANKGSMVCEGMLEKTPALISLIRHSQTISFN